MFLNHSMTDFEKRPIYVILFPLYKRVIASVLKRSTRGDCKSPDYVYEGSNPSRRTFKIPC